MININCNKGRETPNTGNIFDTNEWINPEAKLSEIAFNPNFFFPGQTLKTFPAILGIPVLWNNPYHVPFEKARDRNY